MHGIIAVASSNLDSGDIPSLSKNIVVRTKWDFEKGSTDLSPKLKLKKRELDKTLRGMRVEKMKTSNLVADETQVYEQTMNELHRILDKLYRIERTENLSYWTS